MVFNRAWVSSCEERAKKGWRAKASIVILEQGGHRNCCEGCQAVGLQVKSIRITVQKGLGLMQPAEFPQFTRCGGDGAPGGA
jgi:hypothetical protein